MTKIVTTTAAASQSLVTLTVTAEQFEMLLETAAGALQSNLDGADAELEGEDLLRAAEEHLSAEGIRASGRAYLERAKRSEFAHSSAELKALGEEALAEAEELGAFHEEAIELYRSLLAQAPQLVA